MQRCRAIALSLTAWACLVAHLPARVAVAETVGGPGAAATKPAEMASTVRVVGALRMDNVGEVPPAIAQRALQFGNARPLRLVSWAPDGNGVFVTTRFGETMQLHHVAAPMGARTQWTFGEEPIAFAAVRPTGAGHADTEAVLGIDKGGSEFYQLWHWRRSDAKAELLTDGKSRHEGALWSRDGARLAFVGTARNSKDFDLYLWQPGQPIALNKELPGNWRPLDWSADGTHLLLLKFLSIEESEIYDLEIATGALVRVALDAAAKPAAYGGARYGTAGAKWLTSGLDAEFVRLVRLDAAGKISQISGNINWKVEDFDVDATGEKAAFGVNEDGWSRVYVAGADGKPVLVAGVPDGVVTGLDWSPDGKSLAISLTSATTPGDVWVATWQSPKKPPTVVRWTQTETGGLPASTFVVPTLMHFPTFDLNAGRPRQIPCFVYKPAGKGPFPFVIHIHGGPEAQARPWFDPGIQLWVQQLGLAVLVPNVRGSDGYGKQYLALDNGKKREDSVQDIGALLDWARTQPDLDSKRAAVYGGSYGGYMVLASLVKYADRLKAGIDIVGISNFVSFLENTQAYRRDNRRAEYGDERDPAMREHLHAISPLTHANRIRSRLMVVQGANDPRVPRSEAEQIVAAVRAAGQAVWYLLAMDEGHGFQKKANRDTLLQTVAAFWQANLLQ